MRFIRVSGEFGLLVLTLLPESRCWSRLSNQASGWPRRLQQPCFGNPLELLSVQLRTVQLALKLEFGELCNFAIVLANSIES